MKCNDFLRYTERSVTHEHSSDSGDGAVPMVQRNSINRRLARLRGMLPKCVTDKTSPSRRTHPAP